MLINGYLIVSFYITDIRGAVLRSSLCVVLVVYLAFIIYLIVRNTSMYSRLCSSMTKRSWVFQHCHWPPWWTGIVDYTRRELLLHVKDMVPQPICVGSRESLYAYPLYCIYGISGSRLSPLGWTKAPALSYLRVHAVDRFIFVSHLWRWSWWCEQHYWHNDIAWLCLAAAISFWYGADIIKVWCCCPDVQDLTAASAAEIRPRYKQYDIICFVP